jgi:hypothetical protein
VKCVGRGLGVWSVRVGDWGCGVDWCVECVRRGLVSVWRGLGCGVCGEGLGCGVCEEGMRCEVCG